MSGYRWGAKDNPRVENQKPKDFSRLIQQAGKNCGKAAARYGIHWRNHFGARWFKP